MKTQICSLLLLLLSFVNPWTSLNVARAEETHGASQMISGESLAEKKLRWVWRHRQDFIQACAMSDCINHEPLKTILPQIAKIVPQTSHELLQFKSGKKNPGFFDSNLGEDHRIAITGRKHGSPIYFNTDLIDDLSFENMVALLFHEWTHHLGIADDAQRVPDQVGAAMAKDFTANLFYTPYSGPDNLQLLSAIFHFPVGMKSLPEKFFFKNFAFLTDGVMALDTDLGKFIAYPACDGEGFKLAGQATQTPRWRDLGVVKGQRQIRLSTILVNACYKSQLLILSDYHYARRGYHFDLDLDKNGHIMRSSTESLADALTSDLEAISTLEMLSIQYSKSAIAAGEPLNINVRVKSYTDLKPKDCQFGIALEGAETQSGGFPVVNQLPDCQVKEVGENIWDVSTSVKIPPDMISGTYFVRMIKVGGVGEPNAALLILPEENGFQVKNSNVIKALAIKSIEVGPGLSPLARFGPEVITNSFSYRQGQRIEVRFQVYSSSPVYIKGLVTYAIAGINGKVQAIQNTGRVDDFAGYGMTQKSVSAGADLQTLILSFTVPKEAQGNPLMGMSLQGLFLENETFQQLTWKASGNFDRMFVDERMVNANR